MNKPTCETCKHVQTPDTPLQRVKLTWLCRECVRAFVAAWAKAGLG